MDFMINQIRKQKQGNGFHDRRDLCKQKLQRTAGWAVWLGGVNTGGVISPQRGSWDFTVPQVLENILFFSPFILNY